VGLVKGIPVLPSEVEKSRVRGGEVERLLQAPLLLRLLSEAGYSGKRIPAIPDHSRARLRLGEEGDVATARGDADDQQPLQSHGSRAEPKREVLESNERACGFSRAKGNSLLPQVSTGPNGTEDGGSRSTSSAILVIPRLRLTHRVQQGGEIERLSLLQREVTVLRHVAECFKD
jgi:hypothetical protein